jgi:hypothetical protein
LKSEQKYCTGSRQGSQPPKAAIAKPVRLPLV